MHTVGTHIGGVHCGDDSYSHMDWIANPARGQRMPGRGSAVGQQQRGRAVRCEEM